jgi:predicted nuclease with TOPRIM domain
MKEEYIRYLLKRDRDTRIGVLNKWREQLKELQRQRLRLRRRLKRKSREIKNMKDKIKTIENLI